MVICSMSIKLFALRSFWSSSAKGYHVSPALWRLKMSKPNPPKLGKEFRLLRADKYVTPIGGFTSETRPLVVMLTWMNAKPKHVDKYGEIYLNRGYDVLTTTIHGWQLLLPSIGSQVVAQELLNYLDYFCMQGNQPILLHGFSIGAYFWGEVLLKVKSDLNRYSELMNRVKGVIWDSTPDFKDTFKGLPHAVAPNNFPLRLLVRTYVVLHLICLYPLSTRHHIKSSEALHATPCIAPTLILICKNDPIASVESNLNVKKSWESLGIQTYVKIWDDSKHVSHYILYPEEYLAEINNFLKEIDFPIASDQEILVRSKL